MTQGLIFVNPIPSQRFIVPKTRITNASIEKLKRDIAAGAGRVELPDADARGLVLRGGPGGIVWQFRFEMTGRSSRLTLGAVDEWSIAEARLLVGDARKLIAGRIRRPDGEWIQERRIEYRKVEAPKSAVEDPRQSIYWTYRQALDAYLDHVKRTLSSPTHRDYRQTLQSADLRLLDKRPVPSITRRELSTIIARVHRSGREPTSEAIARKIKPFWKWMSEDLQIDKTGVEPDIMRGLKAPARSRRDEDDDDLDESLYVPPMHEIGRILAITRSGALDPIVGLAIELMIFAPQRRRAVAMALTSKFESIGETEGLWRVPAHHRKTAIRRGDKSDLVLPLPGPAWAAVTKAKTFGDDDRRRLFFRRATPRATATTTDYIDPGTLTKTFSYMPGITASPHDLRRGFATHGQRALGFSLLDAKSILDHSRGFDPGDVTMTHYALHDGTHFTWRIMRSWGDHVEKACAEALEFDDRLRDVDWLKRQLYEARQRAKGRNPRPLCLEKTGAK